jgi:hypothetical protein
MPDGVKVIAKYPHLTHKDMALVSRGLRQFFLAHLKRGRQYVSMPTQVMAAMMLAAVTAAAGIEAAPRGGSPAEVVAT